MKSATVPIDSIMIGERARSDIGDTSSITESAKGVAGQIQSLAVCELEPETDDAVYHGNFLIKYELICGRRRLQAFKEAGLTEVLVRIYPVDLSKADRKLIELIENCARLNLPWQDEVHLVREIHNLQKEIHGSGFKEDGKTKNWTQEDTANLLERARTAIVEDLEVADALDKIPNLANCKNRHEARKFLGALKEQVIVTELASRQQVKIEEGGVDESKKRLIESYKVGDFFDLIKEIPDESIDLIEADPPYGIDITTSSVLRQQDYDTTVRELEMEKFAPINPEEYRAFLVGLIHECDRVMKKDAWMLLWFSSAHEWDFHIQAAVNCSELTFCPTPAVWVKGTGHRNSAPDRRLTGGYESFYYLRKGEAQIVRPGESNVFFYPRGSNADRIHPTEKPVDLMIRVFQTFAFAGCSLLIPFAGSGNSLVAAQACKMNAVGFDKGQEYKDAFTVRVMK